MTEGITEERIKELALELWRHPKVMFQTEDYEIVLEILSQYFRTVATEARKEGIEEAYKILGEGLSLSTAYSKQLHILLERLKEQG